MVLPAFASLGVMLAPPFAAAKTDGLTVKPVSVGGGGLSAVNVAVTSRAELIVKSHMPAPEQAPLQPANAEPAAGVAVSEIPVPPR
jgi:hypothetical protein